MEKMTMDKLVNFCKQYGFIFKVVKYMEDLLILGILVQ